MAIPELTGISLVAAGNFNPAIFSPAWLALKGLIPAEIADSATPPPGRSQLIVSSTVSSFTTDWLTVQIIQGQASFSTVDLGRESDLRDLFSGVFEILSETPVSAVGINSDTHFRVASEEAWHAFGDTFVPKAPWEDILQDGSWRVRAGGLHAGMRSLVIEVFREGNQQGFLRTEIAPSVRVIPHGIYIGLNDHYQLDVDKVARDGRLASEVVKQFWMESRERNKTVISRLMEYA